MIRLLTVLLWGVVLLPAATVSQTPNASIESFLSASEFRTPKISPSGRFLGLTGVRKFHDYLAAIDLETMRPQPLATFTDSALVDYWWKSDGLIVLLVENSDGYRSFRTLDVREKKVIPLHNFNTRGALLVSTLPDESDYILAQTPTARGLELRKLNVRNGKSTRVQEDLGFIEEWVVDAKGQALAGLKRINDEWSLLLRPNAEAAWRELPQGKLTRPNLSPLCIHPDQRRLVVEDNATFDTSRVVAIDLATGLQEQLAHAPTVDVATIDSMGDDPIRSRAIRFSGERHPPLYLRADDERLAAQLNAAVVDAQNLIVSASADESRLVIYSHNPKGRHDYWIFDRRAGNLTSIGSALPALDQVELGDSKEFQFISPDGLALIGRIWFPHVSKESPPPAILVTSNYLQEPYSQALPANLELLRCHGYAIIRADHRGTQGHGAKHWALGKNQLDSGIADDLAQSVKFAADAGWIDPSRVAIWGRGMGGIAAIHAIDRHPTIFRVWIDEDGILRRNAIPTWALVFGLHEWRGGELLDSVEKEARDYRATLDPATVATKVNLPSFHIFGRNNFLSSGGADLQRHLAKSPIPHDFYVWEDLSGLPLEEQRSRNLRVHTEAYGKLLKFLAANLRSPVSATP